MTDRQKQVLKLRAEGNPLKAIGPILGVTEKTVQYHWRQAQIRIGLREVADLCAYAYSNGIADMHAWRRHVHDVG